MVDVVSVEEVCNPLLEGPGHHTSGTCLVRYSSLFTSRPPLFHRAHYNEGLLPCTYPKSIILRKGLTPIPFEGRTKLMGKLSSSMDKLCTIFRAHYFPGYFPG
jgi:hypothetical protein